MKGVFPWRFQNHAANFVNSFCCYTFKKVFHSFFSFSFLFGLVLYFIFFLFFFVFFLGRGGGGGGGGVPGGLRLVLHWGFRCSFFFF
jgi:hypothetical protein